MESLAKAGRGAVEGQSSNFLILVYSPHITPVSSCALCCGCPVLPFIVITQHALYVINLELAGISFHLVRWTVSTSKILAMTDDHVQLSESLKWSYCNPRTADEAIYFRNKILSNMIMVTDCPLCCFI
jgi:hypothetical protein